MSVRLATGRPLPSPTPGTAPAGDVVRPARRTLTSEHLVLPVALATAAAIVVAMALESSILALAGSAAAMLGAVVSPAFGLATLAAMAPLKSPMVVPAPGFNMLLVGAILVGCLYRLPVERRPLGLGLPLVLLSAFVLYVGVQQLPEMLDGYSGRTNRLIGYYFFQLLTGFGAVLAAAYVLRDRSPHAIIVAGLAGAVVAALLAIATFDARAVRAPLIGLIAVPEDLSRAVGPFGNPNYFGQFQATAVVLAVALMAMARSRRRRVLLLGVLLPLGAAMALSLSRGAAVTLLAGLIVLAFARSRRFGVAVIGVTILIVALVYPAFVQWRVQQTNPNSVLAYSTLQRSDVGRLEGVLAGPQLFLTSPLFGIGWGRYQEASTQVLEYDISAHNWYSKVLAEQGLVGTLLWAGLLGSVVGSLRRRPRTARVVGLALFAAAATGSLFAEPPSSFQASALAALMITAAMVADWSRIPGTRPRSALGPGAPGVAEHEHGGEPPPRGAAIMPLNVGDRAPRSPGAASGRTE